MRRRHGGAETIASLRPLMVAMLTALSLLLAGDIIRSFRRLCLVYPAARRAGRRAITAATGITLAIITVIVYYR